MINLGLYSKEKSSNERISEHWLTNRQWSTVFIYQEIIGKHSQLGLFYQTSTMYQQEVVHGVEWLANIQCLWDLCCMSSPLHATNFLSKLLSIKVTSAKKTFKKHTQRNNVSTTYPESHKNNPGHLQHCKLHLHSVGNRVHDS